MRCIEAPCPEPVPVGQSRCAVHQKWEDRYLAEERREREERGARVAAEAVAEWEERKAGRGWVCLPTCMLCKLGSTDLQDQRTISGRLYRHAKRPVRRSAPQPDRWREGALSL